MKQTVIHKTNKKECGDNKQTHDNKFARPSSNHDQILQLHSSVGNQAVQKFFEQGSIQAKLTVGNPNDKYEQEADRVADQVMRAPQEVPLGCMSEPSVQRQSIEKVEDDTIQIKVNSGQTAHLSADMASQIQEIRSGGQPLSPSTRAFFEPRLGRDLSQVRIHTGSNASETARAINAKAFTVGRDVVFGVGQYQPHTTEGKRLLAHELVHVGQQLCGRIALQMKPDFPPTQTGISRELPRSLQEGSFSAEELSIDAIQREIELIIVWLAEHSSKSSTEREHVETMLSYLENIVSRRNRREQRKSELQERHRKRLELTSPRSFEEAIVRLRAAKQRATATPPDLERALAIVSNVEVWLSTIVTPNNIHKYFHGRGMNFSHANMLAYNALTEVHSIQRRIRLKRAKSAAYWNNAIRVVETARPYLEILSGNATRKSIRLVAAVETAAPWASSKKITLQLKNPPRSYNDAVTKIISLIDKATGDPEEQTILAILSWMQPNDFVRLLRNLASRRDGNKTYLQRLYDDMHGAELSMYLEIYRAKLVAARAGSPENIEATINALQRGQGVVGVYRHDPSKFTAPSTWGERSMLYRGRYIRSGQVHVQHRKYRSTFDIHGTGQKITLDPADLVVLDEPQANRKGVATAADILQTADEHEFDYWMANVTLIGIILGGASVAGARGALRKTAIALFEVVLPAVGQYISDHRNEIAAMHGGPEFLKYWQIFNFAIAGFSLGRIAWGAGRSVVTRLRRSSDELLQANPDNLTAEIVASYVNEVDEGVEALSAPLRLRAARFPDTVVQRFVNIFKRAKISPNRLGQLSDDTLNAIKDADRAIAEGKLSDAIRRLDDAGGDLSEAERASLSATLSREHNISDIAAYKGTQQLKGSQLKGAAPIKSRARASKLKDVNTSKITSEQLARYERGWKNYSGPIKSKDNYIKARHGYETGQLERISGGGGGATIEAKVAIEAGLTAERVWGEVLVRTHKNTKTYTVKFIDPITKQRKTVNIIPDFMPRGAKDASGMFLSAKKADEALLIADSKYIWVQSKNVMLDDQIRAMLVLSKQNDVPFVFLLKKGGGGLSKGVKEFADKIGVNYEILRGTEKIR